MPELQRHPATIAILRHFEYAHLPFHLAAISSECHNLAETMTVRLPDGPELTTGLRKLLEAKDCFVRAAVEQHRASAKPEGYCPICASPDHDADSCDHQEGE